MSFKNQAVIITGASSGIGRATALEFAKRGANVVISDINEEGGKEAAERIKANGGKAIFVKTNVANWEEVQALIKACLDNYGQLDHNYGQLDHMINNAGIGQGLYFFDQITNEHWDKTIAVNQTGVFYCMKAALTVMKGQKRGNIINTASAAGIGAAPRMGAYAASKHAVVGMTKTRVNAICPTVIETPMGDSYIADNEELMKIMLKSVPMRRFGKPEEVARTICWCSEDASYLNGVALPVDGGSNA